MTSHNIEISRKGKWLKVPAVRVDETSVIIRGKWFKVASIHDEAWLEVEVTEPTTFLEKVKNSDLHADIFTFAQKLPGSARNTSF